MLSSNLYSLSSFKFHTIHSSNAFLQSCNKLKGSSIFLDGINIWLGVSSLSPSCFITTPILMNHHILGPLRSPIIFPSDLYLDLPSTWILSLEYVPFLNPTLLSSLSDHKLLSFHLLSSSCLFNLIFTLITYSFLKLFIPTTTTLRPSLD